MKRILLIAVAASGLAAAVYYAAPFQPPPRPLASLVPGGALLLLESPDFARELRDWNASPEKAAWLASDNFEEFSRGMLFLRLQKEWESFQQAASFQSTMPVLTSLAGKRSALALYDVSKLEFLYITELPEAESMKTALWEAHAHYEPRTAGGFPFYVRRDDNHTIAFAAAGGYLFLATREEALAGALELLSGAKSPSVAAEPWYTETTAAATAPGDLRLTLNLERIVQVHQFKSHWLYPNQASLKDYWAAIADIHRDRAAIREDRVFLRRDPQPTPESVASIARLAPDTAGFYRALPASPSDAAAELERKLLPKPGKAQAWWDAAPPEPVSPEAGSESDLEIRIDEPPLADARDSASQPLRDAFAQAGVRSMLEAQTSQRAPDGVFVDLPFAIALEAAHPWNEAAIRQALTARLTAAGAPADVAIAARGNLLIIGNSEALVNAMLARINQPPATPATYLAEFRHAQEQPNFETLMSMLDQSNAFSPYYRHDAHPFFSGNLASLGRTLQSIDRVTLRSIDAGRDLRQTVTYTLH